MTEAKAARSFIMADMVQASRRWRKLAQLALAAHGISQARASALVWVHRLGGGIRQIALAGYVGIEGTSLVRLLDELSAAGFLTRQDHPNDRRAKTIWLTPTGESLALQVETVLSELRTRVLEGVDEADIDATLRVCKAVERSTELVCNGSVSVIEGNVLVSGAPTEV